MKLGSDHEAEKVSFLIKLLLKCICIIFFVEILHFMGKLCFAMITRCKFVADEAQICIKYDRSIGAQS